MSYFKFAEESGDLNEWLRLLITERLGPDVQLIIGGQNAVLQHNDYESSIIIGEHNRDFYNISGTINYDDWKPKAFGIFIPNCDTCPCPGRVNNRRQMVEVDGENIRINYDILGLFFWKLSLIEEVNIEITDVHGRASAINSHSYKHNYIRKPIVDIWFSILAQVCKRIWPRLSIPPKKFRTIPTHDVDRPSKFQFQKFFETLRLILSDRHIDKKSYIKSTQFWSRDRTSAPLSESDPYNTFEWLMAESEKRSLKSEFYFLSGTECKHIDADFKLNYPSIQQIMKCISDRGHKLGVHPSYLCYNNVKRLKQEINLFRNVLDELGIFDDFTYSRMHYLRWSHPETFRLLNACGVYADSTLGYHDAVGFRCGTCHEYFGIDPITKERLGIKIRPLIAMDSTILPDDKTNKAELKKVLSEFENVKSECRNYNGDFILLWHNSELYTRELRDTYMDILDA